VCPDIFRAWRAADRAARAAEKTVLAESLRAIDEGTGIRRRQSRLIGQSACVAQRIICSMLR